MDKLFDVTKRLYEAIKNDIAVIRHYIDRGVNIAFVDDETGEIYRIHLTRSMQNPTQYNGEKLKELVQLMDKEKILNDVTEVDELLGKAEKISAIKALERIANGYDF